jgi:hypothetical protein
MIVNVLQRQINEDELIKGIQDFELEHYKNAYLFMNQATLNELAIFYEMKVDVRANKGCNGIVNHYYCGRRVFQNEDLKFGEIEIR